MSTRSERYEYLFGVTLGAGGVATIWIAAEYDTVVGLVPLIALLAIGMIGRARAPR